MRIDRPQYETTQEIAHRHDQEAELIARRHRLPRDLAERIVAMARNIDQAHAIAELMR